MSGLQLSAKFQGSFLFPATVHHLSQPVKKVSVLMTNVEKIIIFLTL